MATNAQLQTALNMLASNLKLATSKEEAERKGLGTFIYLDRHLGRYSVREYSKSYALGLTAYSLTSKEMLTMLEQFCMFHDYLKYRDV